MIGPGRPFTTYRRKHIIRKSYYGFLIVATIVLWHAGGLGWGSDGAFNGMPSQVWGRPARNTMTHTQPRHNFHPPADLPSESTKSTSGKHVPNSAASRAQKERSHSVSTMIKQSLVSTNPLPSRKDTKQQTPTDYDDQDFEGLEAVRHSGENRIDDVADIVPEDDNNVDLKDTEQTLDVTQNSAAGRQKPLGADGSKGNDGRDHLWTPSESNTHGSVEEHSGVDSGPTVATKEDIVLPTEPLVEQPPRSDKYTFPAWEECQDLKIKADSLPDLLHVNFEVAVRDVMLEGWEDEWIASARYTGGKLEEPKIDFVYNYTDTLAGVNGTQAQFKKSMLPYELNSTLNDEQGNWIASHSTNRYREWNELRYSMRSVEKYAGNFTNRIQVLVNAYQDHPQSKDDPVTYGKQKPYWLRDGVDRVQILSQEEFFGSDERKCLPTFNSLTIENQLYNTKSETDRLFALSDDMILGKPHSAADLYSPLFGPTLGFKDNAYNTLKPPTEDDAERFGEKPFLIYTSWLLNRRFGARKRKGQVHFGHSLSRSITREAITSFPRPALRSAMQRFRGETGFQLYSWYVVFHYTMERHREAMLWSYIMLRSDLDDDGYLSWPERKSILEELTEGMSNDVPELYRKRIFYCIAEHHKEARLEPPQVNTEAQWTSMDGPIMIRDLDCDAFDTEDCLAPGFGMPVVDANSRSPLFSSAAIFDRISRQSPRCGDCLLKLILNRKSAGLGTVLPSKSRKPHQRETVVKALMKYQYTIVVPDAQFYMVTDAEQAEHTLLRPYVKQGKKVGQICLNDDVVTTDEGELEQLGQVMSALFEGMLPDPSSFEIVR